MNSKDLLKIFGHVLSLTLLAQAGSEIGSERLLEVSKVYDIIGFEPSTIHSEVTLQKMDLVEWMHRG
jgi:hypothetical protein